MIVGRERKRAGKRMTGEHSCCFICNFGIMMSVNRSIERFSCSQQYIKDLSSIFST